MNIRRQSDLSLATASVVPSMWLVPSEIRAVNSVLLFYPFFVYAMWFLPLGLARVLGGLWLAQ